MKRKKLININSQNYFIDFYCYNQFILYFTKHYFIMAAVAIHYFTNNHRFRNFIFMANQFLMPFLPSNGQSQYLQSKQQMKQLIFQNSFKNYKFNNKKTYTISKLQSRLFSKIRLLLFFIYKINHIIFFTVFTMSSFFRIWIPK